MTLSNTQGHFRHYKTGLKTVSSRTFSNNVMQKMTRKDVQSISDLVTCTLTLVFFYRATFAAFDAPCVGHQNDESQAVFAVVVSVRPFVCLSVTSRYFIETTRRIELVLACELPLTYPKLCCLKKFEYLQN